MFIHAESLIPRSTASGLLIMFAHKTRRARRIFHMIRRVYLRFKDDTLPPCPFYIFCPKAKLGADGELVKSFKTRFLVRHAQPNLKRVVEQLQSVRTVFTARLSHYLKSWRTSLSSLLCCHREQPCHQVRQFRCSCRNTLVALLCCLHRAEEHYRNCPECDERSFRACLY